MKQPIDRRHFLRHSLTTMIAFVVAACTPRAAATPTASATPQPTATPVPVTYLSPVLELY